MLPIFTWQTRKPVYYHSKLSWRICPSEPRTYNLWKRCRDCIEHFKVQVLWQLYDINRLQLVSISGQMYVNQVFAWGHILNTTEPVHNQALRISLGDFNDCWIFYSLSAYLGWTSFPFVPLHRIASHARRTTSSWLLLLAGALTALLWLILTPRNLPCPDLIS